MTAKGELKAGAGGQYVFNLQAVNGQVILTSQLYAGNATGT